MIRQFTNAPILYGVHGEGEWTRNAVAQIAEQVAVLVCVSHGAVRTVPPGQRHKVRLIRGGADLGAVVATREREAIRRDWGIADGELAVGYVGRLSAEKNPVVNHIPLPTSHFPHPTSHDAQTHDRHGDRRRLRRPGVHAAGTAALSP